ncbi:hypothetical protein MNEG_2934 [Monoraphidium neglectum]|uniref:Uncharacterized protein n=1 Tax=Monoraphidium neglectum TaxID=145388 RepID=A0A0D2MQX2_9CHLO|nr:hypothetical protein MNEG_2934 [Monoraphidium neglectum]KIZ05020.1 hypothetical protein MNEG_2934 [Monoraphidium neglectum]|eukprot:XP_013904039.1 hypothetical protein MNEG_2934 [Monoraphidium neglectum]
MDERLVEAAQALLTGYDTALSRHLDNARVLWARVFERNRRDVEEKSEQLKALGNMAALIAGFSLAAFMQFDWTGFVDTTGALLPLFGLTMALTVGFNMIAVIICTLMLVSIIKTGQRYTSDEEEAEFMARARDFALTYRPGMRPPAPHRSFAAHWNTRCETSWRRAFTLFGLSIPACFANLAVAAWIKFDSSVPAAAIVTAIMLLSAAAVAWHHRKWTAHILTKDRLAQGAERIPLVSSGLPFDWHLKPATLPRGAANGNDPSQWGGSVGDGVSQSASEPRGAWPLRSSAPTSQSQSHVALAHPTSQVDIDMQARLAPSR